MLAHTAYLREEMGVKELDSLLYFPLVICVSSVFTEPLGKSRLHVMCSDIKTQTLYKQNIVYTILSGSQELMNFKYLDIFFKGSKKLTAPK